jgi:hypothetical protein
VTPEELLARAEAMHAAKRAGKDRWAPHARHVAVA